MKAIVFDERFSAPAPANSNHFDKVEIRDLVGCKSKARTDRRAGCRKSIIRSDNCNGPGELASRYIGEPVTNCCHGNARLSLVRNRVDATEIGNEHTIAIGFDVEDHRPLQSMRLSSETPCCQEQPEFKRHVEPRQLRHGIEFGSRKVVNSVTGLLNQTKNLVEPDLTSVIDLTCGACPKAACHDREYDRIEYRGVVTVERAIDKYAGRVVCRVGNQPVGSACASATEATARRIFAREVCRCPRTGSSTSMASRRG